MKKQIKEELITAVYNYTKSVALLDKFEGLNSADSVKYKRLVIENGVPVYARGSTIYYHYVIERANERDYTAENETELACMGSITFTEFKKGKAGLLKQYIESELSEKIIKRYKDASDYYRLKKPYYLNAQNSRNRTGYGWKWDWSGGYGSYIEGTQYGETTQYVFSGVYISSSYRYAPARRHAISAVYNTAKSAPFMKNVYGYKKGEYKLVAYKGKLKNYTSNKTESLFIPQERGGKEVLLPVSLSELDGTIYIPKATYVAYKEKLLKSKALEIRKSYSC